MVLSLVVGCSLPAAPLPKRLIIALDGVAYRDVRALQEGLDCVDDKGRLMHRQLFTDGFFPVSRLISTFPSASDVAWTEIFGGRALPGYQRTYYSIAANREIAVNGVTSSADYEWQMSWRVANRTHFALSFVHPMREFDYETDRMIEDFMRTQQAGDNYYALILSTDSAQHMAADILAMLRALDKKLQTLRRLYRAREGHELEILILSDHANNHAGRGRRVQVRNFLKKAGYRITSSLQRQRDVILPTMGLESWVEIHNDPAETEELMKCLTDLKGVDTITGRLPDSGHKFLVLNSRGHRATIDWDPARNAFRYAPTIGDPLEYLPALDVLKKKGQLDDNGFASADAWMAETLTNRYPVALERIVRAHTRGALNPATILISLGNDYMHAGWWVTTGSRLLKSGGTHGALDDLNSTGMLLSNFAPTRDTTTSRVAGLYTGFPGLRDPNAGRTGAEWVSAAGQSTITLTRGPLDWVGHRLPDEGVFLRIWSPRFGPANLNTPIRLSIRSTGPFQSAKIRRSDPEPGGSPERLFVITAPLAFPDSALSERVYALPDDLNLEPRREYRITGAIQNGDRVARLFRFTFFSDTQGRPVPY